MIVFVLMKCGSLSIRNSQFWKGISGRSLRKRARARRCWSGERFLTARSRVLPARSNWLPRSAMPPEHPPRRSTRRAGTATPLSPSRRRRLPQIPGGRHLWETSALGRVCSTSRLMSAVSRLLSQALSRAKSRRSAAPRHPTPAADPGCGLSLWTASHPGLSEPGSALAAAGSLAV